MLLKKPGFTLTAVITLSLGIGATSTIFSFVNGILLRPLPYQDSERLVLLDETSAKRGITSMGISPPNFLDWREQNRVFTGVATYDEGGYSLTGSGEPEQLSEARAFLTTLSRFWALRRFWEGPLPPMKIAQGTTWWSSSVTGCGSADSAQSRKSSAGRSHSTIARVQ
jgi:hypothetical protein